MEKKFSRILKISKCGKSDVYDFTVDETHRILANNFYTSNCSIKHIDAENFIDAKLQKGQITGANISVKINDEFMQAVIKKKPYMQAYPITADHMLDSGFGLDFDDMDYNKIYKGALGLYKKIDAEKLWKKIIHNAWKSAEPGVLFWDMIINESIPDCYSEHGFKTVSTNPCFRGDMKLLTSDGYKTFKELSELENCNLITIDCDIVNGRVWCNGVKEVYDVLIDDNKHIYCTKDHRFLTTDFEELPISECVGKQLQSLVNEPNKNIVQSVTYFGNEDVYDFNLDGNVHWGVVEGVVAHNCGEIMLCPNDSCRLMSLNLFSYVVNPFTDKAYFDYDLFNQDVIEAQRYMDDIIDLEIEKIDKIIEKVKSDPEDEFIKIYELNLWEKIKEKAVQGRRTGLGITAEGDMIAAMGLRYGTDEATDFAVEVHKQLKLSAYRSSVIMAKERGCFPIYTPFNEIENPFINRIKNEDIQLYEDMVMHGRRNIALLTVAPTGCLVGKSTIKTKNGEITLENLFLLNGIDISKLENDKNIWFDLTTNIEVLNVDGTYKKINKLYWNGLSKTKKITYSNDVTTESTLNHKWLVKLDNETAIWKKTEDLVIGDKIIKI